MSCDSDTTRSRLFKERISFNRPKAISCLATWDFTYLVGPNYQRFNRPKAISCLATTEPDSGIACNLGVSIARRRLVVLRPGLLKDWGVANKVSFNRPKAISCLATTAWTSPRTARPMCFNRQKAISCLSTEPDLGIADLALDQFQSPEGD